MDVVSLPRWLRRLLPLAGRGVLTAGATLGLLAAGPWLQAPVAAAPVSICYERLSGQGDRFDIEQLRLDLDGARVSGFYRWIPWQKDRRVGRLDGRLTSPETARLRYRFQQEGQMASAPLTVVFNGHQARLSWDPSGPSGLAMPPVLLPRRSCSQLRTVTGV